MTFALEAHGLQQRYGSIVALAGLDLAVRGGEFVVLLGPNGAGKTTLFRLLTGLADARPGRVCIAGHDIVRARNAALASAGVVFQQPTIDPEMSAWRNLHYHAMLHGLARKVRRRRIADVLQEVGLADDASRKVRALSGGNRRRVELARALLHAPRLLLMDEPTVGLDPGSRRDLLARVDALRREQDVGVLWATHLVDEAESADRIVVLDRGRMLADEAPADLLARTHARDLAQAFFSLLGDRAGTAALAGGTA